MASGLLMLVIVALVTGGMGFGVGFVVGRVSMAAGDAGVPGLPGSEHKKLPLRNQDVLRANPKDLRAGGMVTVKNFGDDFEDADLEFESYTKYARGREEFHELGSTYRNRAVGLGWVEQGGAFKLYALKQLRTKTVADVGLSVEQLNGLARGGQVESDGQTFTVAGAGKTLSHADGSGFGKEMESWDLTSADGKTLLRVERRGADAPQVSQGEAIDPSDVEIFRVKG